MIPRRYLIFPSPCMLPAEAPDGSERRFPTVEAVRWILKAKDGRLGYDSLRQPKSGDRTRIGDMMRKDLQPFEYFLLAGIHFFQREPSLLSTVLGSNVAVSLWDQKKKYGGMANFLYPSANVRESATAQYGNVAVRHLINMFLEEGAKEQDIKAQIFGGSVTRTGWRQVARENIRVAKKMLTKFQNRDYFRRCGRTDGTKDCL